MLPVGFKPVSEIPSYTKMLLYGPPGCGKTKFCADAPNPWWIDFENSTETLRNWPEYRHIPVKQPEDAKDIFKMVKAMILEPECETIVVDTVTSALDSFMMNRAEDIVKRNRSRDEFEFYEQDYKYSTRVFSKIFDFLVHIPINVVVIFHENKVYNKDGFVTAIFPDVTPRLRSSVSRLVNVVAYMETTNKGDKGAERKLHVNANNKIEAKNRLNIQEPFLLNPDWKTLHGH